MNASELLKELSRVKPASFSLSENLQSVLKDSQSIKESVKPMVKTLKVKHNSARGSFVSFRGLDIFFNDGGIAEVPEHYREAIELESAYRPGCFTIVEEVAVEVSLSDSGSVEEEVLAEEDSTEETEEETLSDSTKSKRGKGKWQKQK